MNIIKTKKQMFLVTGAFAAILFLGTVTYAFFSYTASGNNNLAQTGRISFTSQESPRINLSDAFPISSSNINNDTDNVGSVTIHVTGDTSYDDGVEYLVRAVNVSNTITSGNSTKDLPISINVSVGSITTGEAPNQTTTTLGNSDNSYFTNRGGNSSIYKILAGETISEGENLLVGYIAKGATGVNGNIIIKAYINADNILISDTDTAQGKTVFTTSEWNSLDTTGVSFQVTVIAQEGVWVTAPVTDPLAKDVVIAATGVSNVAGAYRYTGATANNYVYFNCTDDSDISTCELWRIIGAYGNNVKIIKNTKISDRVYNTDTSSNVWSTSELKAYLNQETEGGYYYSLTTSAKEKIVSGTWLAGAGNVSDTASELYTKAQVTEVNAKVGLIAAYEYLYAADSSCYSTEGGGYYEGCAAKDWLYNDMFNGLKVWSLSAYDVHSSYALDVNYQYGGSLLNSDVDFSDSVFPAVYLNSTVTITGGTGESTNPYRLG